MKVIFLDHDGVLTTGYTKFNHTMYKICNRFHLTRLFHKFIHPFCCSWIKVYRLYKIVKATDAIIVLTSSLRSQWYECYDKKYNRVLYELHRKLYAFGLDVTSITESNHNRSLEIKDWIMHHSYFGIESYVIIDDETTEFKQHGYGKNIVDTSTPKHLRTFTGTIYDRSGLSRKNVKEAIKILNSTYK